MSVYESADWSEVATKNSGRVIALGVASVIFGGLAVAMPWASGVGIALMVGIALVFGGVARLASVLSAGSLGRGTLAFIGGTLTVIAGMILIARPGIGLATLTLMLGAFLLTDGIFSAVAGWQLRPARGSGMMMLSATLSCLLGFLLLKEWPLTGLWAIGTLFGVNVLFSGITMIAIGSAAKKIPLPEE